MFYTDIRLKKCVSVFDSLPNRYMTQGMCDKAVNSYLVALNLLLIGLL